MLRILDRYLLRELVTPFVLSLLLLTFALEIPPIIDTGEQLIAKGVSWGIISRILVTLLPQALGVAIPMALLIAILIVLGRLSGDRETVALEACGVSLARLLRPLMVFSALATGVTAYIMIVALPAANQAYREITFRVVSSMADNEVKPRVFFTKFTNVVLFARDVKPGVGWNNVVVADTSAPNEPKLHLARRGRVMVDTVKKTVQLVLEDGTTHTVKPQEPGTYRLAKFDQTVITVDPSQVFPREGPMKNESEMTVAELKQRMAELEVQKIHPHRAIMAWQKKFSIPAACVVFTLIALGLGVSNRRDGKLAAFVLGIGVVFIYYMLMYFSEALAQGEVLGDWFSWAAMWVPNVVVGLWGALLITRRMVAPERAFQFPLPLFTRQPATAPSPAEAASSGEARSANPGKRARVSIRLPRFGLPGPSILDWYVLKAAGRISALAGLSLLGLFYISTFIDLSDHLFKGRTTGMTVLRYLWFVTPQFTYFVIPLAVLIGTLVTIGSLTKNSELTVMRACGISPYRTAAPLLMLALVGSAALFGLEERVLAFSNKKADTINDAIRGRMPRTTSLNRQWIATPNGNIYQYLYFEAGRNRLVALSVYEFSKDLSTLVKRSYFTEATFAGNRETKGLVTWQAASGWMREFRQDSPDLLYTEFKSHPLVLEGPGYFGSELPVAEAMSYGELRQHINELRASGLGVDKAMVDLHRKIAFPFITLIMALIAVPFAVTTGKRGAMYGIGAGIVLAIVYWIAMVVFSGIGAAGLISPLLAAWAPNLVFGSCALYLLLTVRT